MKRISICLFLLLIASVHSASWGQQPPSARPHLFFPAPFEEKQIETSLGFILISPPAELTEEVYLRAPAFDVHAMYGLPSNFLLEGRGLIQVLQNHLSLGGHWTTEPVGNFSFSAGTNVAYWFGFLDVSQFDSKAYGWNLYPGVSAGYAFDKLLLSFRTEALFVLSNTSKNGDIEITSAVTGFTGMSFTLALEQPFYKSNSLSLAFTGTYAKFHWMTWALFSTFDKYLFYPQITVGFIL